jgi:hypothetical protein
MGANLIEQGSTEALPSEAAASEVLGPLAHLESRLAGLSDLEQSQIIEIAERIRGLVPCIDTLPTGDRRAVYFALDLVVRYLLTALEPRQRLSQTPHPDLLVALVQVVDWLADLALLIEDRDAQRVTAVAESLTAALQDVLQETPTLPRLPARRPLPRPRRYRIRCRWLLIPSLLVLLVLVGLIGFRLGGASGAVAAPAATRTYAGDPADTASPPPSPTTPANWRPNPAAPGTAYAPGGSPSSPVGACSFAPAFDFRRANDPAARNYYVDVLGYPVECLPVMIWEGSLDAGGLDALRAFARNDQDPVYGAHPVPGAAAIIVTRYGPAGAEVVAGILAVIHTGSGWVDRISTAVAAVGGSR